MSAAARVSSSVAVSSRRLSELDASREISRVAASSPDLTFVIESIAAVALKVSGVRRIRIRYEDPSKNTPQQPFEWGVVSEEGSTGSAVANITANGHTWGELRLFFDLQPSALESPLRFAKFLAQQVGVQLSRWSLNQSADVLRLRAARHHRKTESLQRARAILANTQRVNDCEAIRVMRQYSKESGRTLHQVAEA